MENNKITTEYAFPLTMNTLNQSLISNGMTLRDYFASKAMGEVTWSDEENSALVCYSIADAMLKAREKN